MSTKNHSSKIKNTLPFLALVLMLTVNFKNEVHLGKEILLKNKFSLTDYISSNTVSKDYKKTTPVSYDLLTIKK